MKLAAHALVLVTFVAAPILQVGVANAETATPSTPSAQDRAERLFQEGKALMGEERFREACPKFEASQKLDPATGTLLALALCHEGEGKIATAYREFREALPAVQADGRRDREQLVQTRIRELAPRIPRIVVDLERAAREDSSLRVTLDGEPIQAFNTDLFVDPGEHVLMATGNGKPWRTKVQVPEQALRRLVVPPLEPLPTNEPSASNTPGVPPTRVIGMGLVAAGALTVGVGAVFGVTAIQKSNEAKSLCDPAACGDARAVGLNHDAKEAATVSTVAISIGLAALVGGGILWLTSKRGPSVTASPAFGQGGAISGGVRF